MNTGVASVLRRTPDLPLYTLTQSASGVVAETTDPGVALQTGKFADIGKFKVPGLRGLASRAPFFHNGSASDLPAVVGFYQGQAPSAKRAGLVSSKPVVPLLTLN
jgi:cytochrome c peroxidase